jgi:SAM-dependent methyltransferase
MQIKKHLPAGLKQRVRAIQNQLKLINSRHFCPVCESRVASFLPLPDFYRENGEQHGFPFRSEDAETCNEMNYLCPACQATDRDRLYALFLREHIAGLRGPIQMVEFGPSQPLSRFIRSRIQSSRKDIRYRTADLLAEDVDERLDITDLSSYKNDALDFFICSHVLEHVADDRQALRELYRVLRPGATAILMVPIILTIDEIDEHVGEMSEAERWRRFGQSDHVRLYSKKGFVERVREAGFKVHELGKDYFGSELFDRAGISKQSVLYVVEK